MRFLYLFLVCIVLGCNKHANNQINFDFSKDQDFRIVSVFNKQKYNELKEYLPNQIKADTESEESYRFYSYLSLKPNKEFTFLIGNSFMYGNYEVISKDEILLKSVDFGSISFKIMQQEGDYIQVYGDFKNYKSDMMVELDGSTHYYLNLNTNLKKLNKENDIRSLAFNQWRFPPIKEETDVEIRNRLIQNLKYITAYMRVHMYGGYSEIHTAGIYSPFLYAKNGLFLYEWQRVDYFWKHIFYNEKDAEKAYNMLKNTFYVIEAPEFIDNWLAYNESCIQKLIIQLEKDNENKPSN